MKNGQKLIGELGKLRPKQVFFRTHNLLCTGDGTPALKWGSTNAYTRRRERKSDLRLDHSGPDLRHVSRSAACGPTCKSASCRKPCPPSPSRISIRWTPRARYEEIYTGWAYPPKDYNKWGELAYQWAKHCIDRYGREEVETWYWQVWNEANIGYWRGTPEEFLKLHDYAIAGVRRALPTAKVGGADTAGDGGRFTRRFIEHCLNGTNFATGEKGTPLDFVSFHAKGAPIVYRRPRAHGHRQPAAHDRRRFSHHGLVSGNQDEADHHRRIRPGRLRLPARDRSSPTATARCSPATRRPVFPASIDLAARHGVNFEGALTWAFEFEGHPYFAGFRSLATNGIDKPVLNTFRMFSKMGGQRLSVESDHAVPLDRIVRRGVREQPDVAALASLDGDTLAVMVWHYHDDDVPGPAADIKLALEGLPVQSGTAQIQHFRIDEDHSNAYAAWKQMGSPQQPTDQQYAELEKAGQLAELKDAAADVKVENGTSHNRNQTSSPGCFVATRETQCGSRPQTPRHPSDNSTRRVEPVPPALREKFELDPFYEQYVDAGGLPILSSAKVSPAGLLEAAYLIDQMLANREDVRQEMIKRRVRFVVMAPTEMTTDVPEQSHMDKEYWDRRARGLGGRICSCGEENLLNLPGDRYSKENILIHEFSHTIHNYGLRRLDDGFQKRLTDLFDAAKEKGLWKDTYAAYAIRKNIGPRQFSRISIAMPRRGVECTTRSIRARS